METEAEPVSTKTHVEEAVILDQSFMEVGKKNLSTVLDNEITSQDCRNKIGEAEVAEVVNGSGNKEEATKTVSVAGESKISERDKDEPESFNTSKEDVKILLNDVTLEKDKEDNISQKPEKACEEILSKTDEVKEEEEDSTTVETSLNGTESTHDVTVSVEESLRNIENQTVPDEEETARDDEVATTKGVEIEEDKEEMKIDAEPSLNVIKKVEADTVKTTIEDLKIVDNEETTVHESVSLKGSAEPEEAIRNSEDAEPEEETVKTAIGDLKVVNNEETTVNESESLKANEESKESTRNSEDAEQISSVVIADREKEEAKTQKPEEVQGEDIESKVSVELKEEVDQCSKDTEKHEHVLGRDIPHCENLEAEAVDTSTVKEATLLKSLETNINETEAVHNAVGGEEEGQETKKDTETSLDLKEVIEEEETEMVKTIISSDEVISSEVQAEVLGEHNENSSSEIKDESHGRQDESTEEKHGNVLDVTSTESEKYQDNEPETALVANTESPERFEELPLDSVLKVDKEELKDEEIKVDQVDETQTMKEQRGQNSDEPEAEQIDRNRTDEKEEVPIAHPFSVAVEKKDEMVAQVEQTRDIEPSLIEECSMDQTLPVEQVKETCFIDDQKKEETETNGESLHNVETTTRVLEVAKEEKETEIINNDETTAHESQGKNAESVEAIKDSDDGEKLASEVTGDKEKEEDITQKTKEMKESPSVIETLTIQGEDIESKASLVVKEESDQSSKDTEAHEHELKAEAVDTSTVQEAAILKNLETEDKERSLDLNEEVDAQAEELGEHTGPCSSEIIDESKGREESVQVKYKETVQDERSEEKDVNLLDVQSGESEKYQDNKPEISLVSKTESQDHLEEIPSDLALNGTQTKEEPRGLDLNDQRNITDETEESPAEKLVAVEGAGLDETTHNQTFVDVESLEKMQTSSLDSLKLSKEDVTVHQEGQEEGSNGLDRKEEVVSVPDGSELEAKTHGEESCLPNEEEKEIKLQIEKHEPTKEEVLYDHQNPGEEKSDESIQISSASPTEDREGETVLKVKKIEDIKENEEEKEEVTDKIKRSLESVEIVEPHSSLPSSSEEQHHGTVAEAKKTEDEKPSLPSLEQNKEIRDCDEEYQIPSVASPLEEQEKVTPTEEESQDDKVDSSTLPMLSEKNDNETLLEAPKLEELKEDKSQDISETSPILSTEKSPSYELVSELGDQIPREVEGIHEEETKQTHYSEVAAEEIHEEETKETHKLHEEEILPTKTVPKESFDEAPVSMLASGEHEPVTLKEGNSAGDVRETDEEKRPVSADTEERAAETKPTESVAEGTEKSDDQVETSSYVLSLEKAIAVPKVEEPEAPKLEESKELKSREIQEISEAIEARGDQTLPIETSQADQTPPSELVSRLDDQFPRQADDIHEEETKEGHKFEATGDQSLPVEISQEYQTLSSDLDSRLDDHAPQKVEEIHEEEKKEAHKSQVARDQSLLAETSQADQTASLVSELENHTPETVNEIHEEETKEAHILQVATDQTPSLVSEQDDQTLKQVEKIHEEETKEAQNFQDATDQALPVETSLEDQTPSLVSEQDDQTPTQVEKIHDEETKEAHDYQDATDQALPVETLHEDLTLSSVSEQDDQAPKQAEKTHEEETKEARKLQAEEILPTETFPTESFSEPPVSMLASREDDPVTLQEGQFAGDTQEERHVSADTEPKESDDQVETSTNLPKVEDERTMKTDIEVAELTNGQSMSNRPENACLKQELKDTETLLHDAITEDQSPPRNDYSTGESEHGDETTSNLPVVEILKGLQTTLETERATNESASLRENIMIEQADTVQKTSDAKVKSNEEDSAAEIVEASTLQQDESVETAKTQEEKSLAEKSLPIEELNLQDEDKEEVKVQDGISTEFEVSVEKKLQEEEIREIAEKQEHKEQQDVNASTEEKISLQEEQHPRDSEISKKVEDNSDQVMELPADQTQTEQKPEIHEIFKEEDQIVDLKEVPDEKLGDLSATRDIKETFSFEVKKDHEDASDLGVGHDFASPQVEKEEESHSLLGNDVEIKEVATSDDQITYPVEIIKKSEHEPNEEHVEPQAISDDAKTHSDRDFPTEQAPKEQREKVNADISLTKEAFDEQIQVPSSEDDQDHSVKKPSGCIQPNQSLTPVEETSFKAPEKDKETADQQQKSNDLTYVQEDNGKNVELEVRDDEIRGDGYDSVVSLKKDAGLIEEKREVNYVKTELEDAIKHGVSVQENNVSENIDGKAKKEICQEESKQTETVTAIKEEELSEGSKEMPAEKKAEETMFLQKETAQESMKNTDDAIHKTQLEFGEIESSSSVSKTQDISKQEEEIPNQQKREIADEVLKPENLKNAEELQQKDGESEPTVEEPARKSLSDLIQKVKPTSKTEDATRESHIEEETKTEEEEEEEEEHKEDKTSPDSIVMVEAKDTVSIIKTQKKSHGILSGVGSKVKHSISKVKKVLTGKSSHTSKPSSPK